jgi:hypothetical protein
MIELLCVFYKGGCSLSNCTAFSRKSSKGLCANKVSKNGIVYFHNALMNDAMVSKIVQFVNSISIR